MDLDRLAANLVGQLRNRLELLTVEWQEEKLRLGALLLRALLALFLLQIAVILVALWAILAFWDSPWRLHGIGLVALAAAGGAALCWRAFRAQSEGRPKAFAGTLSELRKDEQILERPG